MRRRAVAGGATLLLGYVGACLLFFTQQRALIYPAEARNPVGTFSQALPDAGPVIVHFHSNGQNGADLERQRERWQAYGVGFFAVDYPGYCRTPGEPSEKALYEHTERELEGLVARGIARDRLVLFGQSLGTGPAVELARRGWGRSVVLVTPFTSMGEVAQRAVPYLPARWLVLDRYDSVAKAAEVKQPVLVVHGTNDAVYPHEMGAELARRFPSGALLSVEGGTHDDVLERDGTWERIAEAVLRP